MEKNGGLNQIIRAVGFLTVLFAIAFSLPPAAHASMMQNSSAYQHIQQNDMNTIHGTTGHDMMAMVISASQENSPDTHHENTNCCSGICADIAVIANVTVTFSDEVHTHVALPFSQMGSVSPPRLMRPPNL